MADTIQHNKLGKNTIQVETIRHYGVPEKQNLISPTKLASLAKCETGRYAYLNGQKYRSTGTKSAPLILGTAAHEIFRYATEMSKSTWLKSTDISSNIAETAAFACNDALEAIKINDPDFLIDAQRIRPFWQQWVTTWLNQRANVFSTLVNDGMSATTALADALPLTEVDLKSNQLGIYGRADQIFQRHNKYDELSIKVTDLKTDERITTYLSQQSHQIQLVTYAVVAEETLNLPCDQVSILFLKNMDEQVYTVTSEAKSLVKDLVKQYREIITTVNPPPMLTGLDAEMRCPRCPLNKQCYRLAELNGEF